MAAGTADKKPNIFNRMMRSIRDMRGEMGRVVWPTRKQTVNNTVIVLIFMVMMAIIVGLFDTGLSLLISRIFAM